MAASLVPCECSSLVLTVLLTSVLQSHTKMLVTSITPKSSLDGYRELGYGGSSYGPRSTLRSYADYYRYRGIRHSRLLLSASAERSISHHRRGKHEDKAADPESRLEKRPQRQRTLRASSPFPSGSSRRSSGSSLATKPQPASTTYSAKRRMARTEGDIIIGALFPVHHHPPIQTAYSRVCGGIREYYGIQRIETFLRTVDDINRNTSILPNIQLGWDIRDSCWYSAIALEQSIDFIQDAIASRTARLVSGVGDSRYGHSGSQHRHTSRTKDGLITNITSTSSSGSHRRTPDEHDPACSASVNQPIVGLVGPGSSEASIQVQNLMQIFNIPQIGYSATSMDLSDKNIYRYFLRVVPPDNYQVQALVDIVLAFNWTYISTVHSDECVAALQRHPFLNKILDSQEDQLAIIGRNQEINHLSNVI